MSQIDPARRIDALSHGFWESALLFAGVRSGLFAALADGPLTADEVATKAGLDARAVLLTLRGLAGLGLIAGDGDRWAIAAGYADLLVPGAPDDRTAILEHLAGMWEAWGRLPEVLREGRPVRRADLPGADRRAGFRAFIMCMHQLSARSAEAFAALPELADAASFLDVGAGPGTYAIAMARRTPALRATSSTAPRRWRLRASSPRGRRCRSVRLHRATRLPTIRSGFMQVLLSAAAARPTSGGMPGVVARGAAALAPADCWRSMEFVLDPGGTSPAEAAIFGVNMLVNTETGRTYEAEELEVMMREAGLEPAGRRPLAGRSLLILARRPG